MFNETARIRLNETIRTALETLPADLVATEAELNQASGMVTYALLRGDITKEDADLQQLRIDMARMSIGARILCHNRQAVA
ncbi:hypothetical protein QEM13_002011 [Pseudomonas putida]|nr:hypothetical protein [Pseudomonas putida]